MKRLISLRCTVCRKTFRRAASEVKYRRAHGLTRAFCSKRCFGRSRRTAKATKVARKAEYDREYRAANRALLKQKKAARHKATYDPNRARIARAARAAEHAKYIKRYYADPNNKLAKVLYDRRRRASVYGEFAGAYEALVVLRQEILARCPDRYERLKARGYYDRPGAQKRRRDAQISRW